MKLKQILTSILPAAALFLAVPANAQDDHKDHDHKEHKGEDHKDHDDHEGHDHGKKIAGPNGGRILTGIEPHLEFFVTKDRKVKITAVDDHGKAVALGEQSVRIIAGDRSKPTRMSFAKDGESLISDKAFPEGNDFPVVVQIKAKPDAKTVIEKFNLDLSDCPTCKYKEYACVCDHDDEEEGHEGHDH